MPAGVGYWEKERETRSTIVIRRVRLGTDERIRKRAPPIRFTSRGVSLENVVAAVSVAAPVDHPVFIPQLDNVGRPRPNFVKGWVENARRDYWIPLIYCPRSHASLSLSECLNAGSASGRYLT